MDKKRLLELAGVVTEDTSKVWLDIHGEQESYGTVGPFQSKEHANRWFEQIKEKDPSLFADAVDVLSPEEFYTTLEHPGLM